MAQLKYLDLTGLQTFLNNINNTITEEVAAAGSQIESKYGIANGVATLDASAKLVASQLPDITTLQVGTVGSTTQPVYFNNGTPTAIRYTIQKSVPANAIFTDTVYTLPNAGDSTLGGIKTGFTTTGKRYAIKVDSSGNAYVDVAWTDTKYTLSSFGITTDAAHLNYVSDVTSNIQAQLNGKVSTNGTGATGTWGISISGNAATATTATSAGNIGSKTVTLTGDVTGTATWNTSGNLTINTTAASSATTYKNYVKHKFTAATSSYTIPQYAEYQNPDIEVYFNGFLLTPNASGTTDGDYNRDGANITFNSALGGNSTEQELVILIRSSNQVTLMQKVATPVITIS